MRRQDPRPAVERPGCVQVFPVRNPIGKSPDEFDGVDHLPEQVARIEVKPELRTMIYRFQGALGGVDIKGDLGGMDLEGKLDVAFLEDVEDRVPAIGEQLESLIDCGV